MIGDGTSPDGEGDGAAADDKYVCAICLSPAKASPHHPMQLVCRHVFHAFCLRGWTQRSDSCPLCRRRMVVLKGKLVPPVRDLDTLVVLVQTDTGAGLAGAPLAQAFDLYDSDTFEAYDSDDTQYAYDWDVDIEDMPGDTLENPINIRSDDGDRMNQRAAIMDEVGGQ